jgi:3-oxoacyl-[acyl-carrier-protein] synthase II
MDESRRRQERVAITGVAISCALGNGAEEVWKAVRSGTSGIGLTQRLDVSTLSCHYSGEVRDVPWPNRRPRGRLDRASKLALSATDEAIRSAQLDPGAFDPYRVGVALGTSVGGLDEGEKFHWELLGSGSDGTVNPDAARKHHLLVYPLYTSADAISVAFGLRGPKVVISNACAAGANSIGWAVEAIRNGRADAMVAGGVDVLDILSLAGFDSLKALDDKPCAPLSRSTGLNLGEGAAMIVLESESTARQRNATVLGWLMGYALSSDAHHATAPDPSGSGARRSMSRAIEQAGLRPSDVDYVNAHGTGTPANDSSEPKAIDAVFAGVDKHIPISSTKSQVGHMLGAAGAIEAAVSTLALRDGVLPPTINVTEPEKLTRDIVPNTSREQEIGVVVSNSFAFGGNNCSVVFGNRPGKATDWPTRRVVITGAGLVSPVGVGRRAFLDALAAGKIAIGPAKKVNLSLSRTKQAAEITDNGYRKFVDPAYARRLDQLGLLVLSSCRMALQDANYKITRDRSERVGMVFGTFTGPLETVAALTETIGTAGPDKVNPRLFPNSVMNAAVGHACLSLQVKGPLSTLATGCASGVAGLGYAVDLVRQGEADVMLAVAADELTDLLHLGFDKLGMLSDSASRPYAQTATGSAIGAGGAALVVESLDHALERGATILAEIRGHSVTSDAYRVAGNEPSGQAWSESFRRAIAESGLTPAEVGTVYGDARGTPEIDLAEARAVGRVWEPGTVRVANLAGNVGHVYSTTALWSAVCATETFATGWVPRIPGLTDPLPEIAPYLSELPDAQRRSALITAANWGGTYASAVLSPYSDES